LILYRVDHNITVVAALTPSPRVPQTLAPQRRYPRGIRPPPQSHYRRVAGGALPFLLFEIKPCRTLLEFCGKSCALGDGAFGIQFGGDIGASDHMHALSLGGKRISEAPVWLLAGADNDVIDG
jgi:hypothetical protein